MPDLGGADRAEPDPPAFEQAEGDGGAVGGTGEDHARLGVHDGPAAAPARLVAGDLPQGPAARVAARAALLRSLVASLLREGRPLSRSPRARVAAGVRGCLTVRVPFCRRRRFRRSEGGAKLCCCIPKTRHVLVCGGAVGGCGKLRQDALRALLAGLGAVHPGAFAGRVGDWGPATAAGSCGAMWRRLVGVSYGVHATFLSRRWLAIGGGRPGS